MQQLALVARLKPDMEVKAAELIAHGPPFGIDESDLERHTVYLSTGEVVFVFEGHEVEWIVDSMINSPFRWKISDALDAWRPLVEGSPRVARPAFSWQRSEPGLVQTGGGTDSDDPESSETSR
jgi:hypothetical protein